MKLFNVKRIVVADVACACAAQGSSSLPSKTILFLTLCIPSSAK